MTEWDRRRIEAGVEPARTSRGERYAMNENINVVPLRQPDVIDDPLTNILRSGARQLLAQAVEMEAEAFLAAMASRSGLAMRTAGPNRCAAAGGHTERGYPPSFRRAFGPPDRGAFALALLCFAWRG